MLALPQVGQPRPIDLLSSAAAGEAGRKRLNRMDTGSTLGAFAGRPSGQAQLRFWRLGSTAGMPTWHSGEGA